MRKSVIISDRKGEEIMVYAVRTVGTKPGKRFAGIDQLKKLAVWMSDKYGTPTQVLGNGTGLIYQNHIMTQCESVAQMEEISNTMPTDAEFQEWFGESEGLVEWQDSTAHYFTVFE